MRTAFSIPRPTCVARAATVLGILSTLSPIAAVLPVEDGGSGHSPELALEEAEEDLFVGDYESALETIRAVLAAESAPEDVRRDAHLMRAVCLLRTGRRSLAVEAFESALLVDSGGRSRRAAFLEEGERKLLESARTHGRNRAGELSDEERELHGSPHSTPGGEPPPRQSR
jgi:tetratricopeptide (TPR) repeat protein